MNALVVQFGKYFTQRRPHRENVFLANFIDRLFCSYAKDGNTFSQKGNDLGLIR
jgi:hypothetical protein